MMALFEISSHFAALKTIYIVGAQDSEARCYKDLRKLWPIGMFVEGSFDDEYEHFQWFQPE